MSGQSGLLKNSVNSETKSRFSMSSEKPATQLYGLLFEKAQILVSVKNTKWVFQPFCITNLSSVLCKLTMYSKKSETSQEQLRRVCRMGCGIVELAAGTGLTPGYTTREKPVIVRDLRGFNRLDMIRDDSVFDLSPGRTRSGASNVQYQRYLFRLSPTIFSHGPGSTLELPT